VWFRWHAATLEALGSYGTQSQAAYTAAAGGVVGREQWHSFVRFERSNGSVREETVIRASGNRVSGLDIVRRQVVIVGGVSAIREAQGQAGPLPRRWRCVRASTDPYVSAARPLLSVRPAGYSLTSKVRTAVSAGIPIWRVTRTAQRRSGKDVETETIVDDISRATYRLISERIASDEWFGALHDHWTLVNTIVPSGRRAPISLPRACQRAASTR
jgi:hypothetical protein